MTKSEANLAFALLTHYSNKYEQRYGKQPNINKYKEKWAASSIIDDFGFDNAKQIIDYYFVVSKDGHPLPWLFNNFDKLNDAMTSQRQDEELRAQRRKEMAKLREEWLNGNA